MARFPDEPGNYSEGDPTQYANYGGTGGEAYSEYGTEYGTQPGYQPPTGYGQVPPPVAQASWFQRPAALVGLGVLTAALLALLIYAIVRFTGAGPSGPTVTPASSATTSSATTSAAPSSSAEPTNTQTAAPVPLRLLAPWLPWSTR